MTGARIWTRGLCVALACSTAGAAPRYQVAGEEVFYGLRTEVGVNWKLVRMDSTGVAETWFHYLPPPSQLSLLPLGLTEFEGQLLTINVFGFDTLHRLHPADASRMTVGYLGFDTQGEVSVERHPLTGVVYLLWLNSLYTVDAATGATQLLGAISGLVPPNDALTALAIDSTGDLVVSGNRSPTVGNRLYSVDPSTLTATALGGVQISQYGKFRDLAFGPNDQLWGSYRTTNNALSFNGLYRLDLGTFTATLIRQLDDPYYGLAFVPRTSSVTFCSSKTNSAGCSPVVSGDGWPSPTASSGYVIRCDDVVNQTVGVLLYTASGRAMLPFGGGTLCIATPRRRTPLRQSGGSPAGWNDCSGAWSVDFNSHLQTQAQLPAGLTLRCQWMGRDSGFAPPNNYQLSNALEFTLEP